MVHIVNGEIVSDEEWARRNGGNTQRQQTQAAQQQSSSPDYAYSYSNGGASVNANPNNNDNTYTQGTAGAGAGTGLSGFLQGLPTFELAGQTITPQMYLIAILLLMFGGMRALLAVGVLWFISKRGGFGLGRNQDQDHNS